MIVGFLVRLAYLLEIKDTTVFAVPVGDGVVYDRWAQSIARGNWFGEETFLAAPLYPYFLASFYAVFGRDLLVVRVVQCMLGSLACCFVTRAGCSFFSPRVGLLAGALMAVYAPALFFDALIQKSVLDVFFMSLLLLLLGEALRRTGWPWPFAAGLALGFLSLARENALILAVVVGPWLWLRGRDEASRSRWRDAGLFAAGLGLVLLPVGYRNWLIGGEFHLTTPNFGGNFYVGNNARSQGWYAPLREWRGNASLGRRDSADLLAEYQDATELQEKDLGPAPTPAAVSAYWARKAFGDIRADPGRWLVLMVKKVLLVWNAEEIPDSEEPEVYADHSVILGMLGRVFHFGMIAPLALLGVVSARGDRGGTWLLRLILLAYTASIALFYVFARYRYPMVPVLLMFAAAASCRGVDRLRRGEYRPLVRSLSALALWAALVNLRMVPDHPRRATTYFNLGVSLSREERHDEALVSYERALAIRPDFGVARFNLANELRALGRADEAIGQYRLLLRAMPENAYVHNNLSVVLDERGEPDAALVHRRRALQLNPDLAGESRIGPD